MRYIFPWVHSTFVFCKFCIDPIVVVGAGESAKYAKEDLIVNVIHIS